MLIYLLNRLLLNSLKCQNMLRAQNTKINEAINLNGPIGSSGDKNMEIL